jgi:hypothetical protein
MGLKMNSGEWKWHGNTHTPEISHMKFHQGLSSGLKMV